MHLCDDRGFNFYSLWCVLCCLAIVVSAATGSEDLKVAIFDVDATPPIGSPVAYAPTAKILDPLHARGVIFIPGEQLPIVLCAVDWIGIANGGHDRWRSELAQAAGTTKTRVAVHVIHQHDGPRYDSDAIEHLSSSVGEVGAFYDVAFVERVLDDVTEAISVSVPTAQSVTHLGVGRAKVEQVASNRRDLWVRMAKSSACVLAAVEIPS